MWEDKKIEEVDGDAMCYRDYWKGKQNAIPTIVQKEKKSQEIKKRKNFNAVKFINLNELYLNRWKKGRHKEKGNLLKSYELYNMVQGSIEVLK